MITSQHRKQLLLLTATMAMVVSIFGTWQAAPSHAANYNQTQIDAGLARMQKATPRTDSFMSMEVAPEVTSAVPLKAGMHRLWDMKTAWKDVNPSKGAFDWSVLDARVAQAEASGARPMLVLGLTPTWAASDPNAGDARWGLGTASPPKDINDWKNYVQAVVSRYGGRIAAYEVWNEANLQTFWTGSFDQLAELTDTAYDIVKATSPSSLVLMASTTTRLVSPAAKFTTGYLEALGRYGNPFDGYTIHTYPAGDIPFDEISAQRKADITAWQTAVVKAVGPDSPLLDRLIFDTEVNYGLAGPGTRPGTHFSDAQGATLLEQTYRDSAAMGIDATFWYLYTAAPFDLLGVQMWSGTPLVNAKWNELRAGAAPANPTPSVSPTGVTGPSLPSVPRNFAAWGQNDELVKFHWEPSETTLDSPVTYVLQSQMCPIASKSCDNLWDTIRITSSTNSGLFVPYLDTPGIYRYRVRASNPYGKSDWSEIAQITVTTRLTAPTNVDAFTDATSASVFWHGSSTDTDLVSGYRIEAHNVTKQTPWRVLITTKSGYTTKRFTLADLQATTNDVMEFRVTTIGTNGQKSPVSEISPRRQLTNALPVPTNVKFTYDRSTRSAKLTWDRPDVNAAGGMNVRGYEIQHTWAGQANWASGMFDSPTKTIWSINMGNAFYSNMAYVARVRSVGVPGWVNSEFVTPPAITGG